MRWTMQEYEKNQDVIGYYFIQTKYIRDYNDDNCFPPQKLVKLGMEIGSHTVAHSRSFSHLGERVPQAVELARQIDRYGGSFVVLIHPNILVHKLEFEKRFVE